MRGKKKSKCRLQLTFEINLRKERGTEMGHLLVALRTVVEENEISSREKKGSSVPGVGCFHTRGGGGGGLAS